MTNEHGNKEVSDSFLMQAKTEVGLLRAYCERNLSQRIKRPLKKLEELIGSENLYKVLMFSNLTVGKKVPNQIIYQYATKCYEKMMGPTDKTPSHKLLSPETLEKIAKAAFPTQPAKTPILEEKSGFKHNKRKNPPHPNLEKFLPLSPFPTFFLPEAQPFKFVTPENKENPDLWKLAAPLSTFSTGYPPITSLQGFYASRVEQQKLEQRIALLQELICCQQLIHANEKLANLLTSSTTPAPLTQAYSTHGLLQPPKTGASNVLKTSLPFYGGP